MASRVGVASHAVKIEQNSAKQRTVSYTDYAVGFLLVY